MTLGQLRRWFQAHAHAAWRHSKRARPPEPGAALFRGLRLRLTLWYGGVLAASLLLTGVVLYIGLQQRLLAPVSDEVSAQMGQMVRQWQFDPDRAHTCGAPGPNHPGGPPGGFQPTSPVPIYVACFDPQGRQLQANADGTSDTTTLPASFLNNTLVSQAIRKGSANDIVDGGTGIGGIYRAAQAVHDPNSGTLLGVVQVGRSIQEQQSALGLLRTLLFIVGGLALLVATLGGLLLSGRALIPAHLAFRRQQAFIADASHELRTPLTLLRANAEVLLRGRGRLPEEDAELLDDIVTETDHMDRLTSDLLTLARLDAGRLHLERDVVDLTELAVDTARRLATLAEEKGVRIEALDGPPVVLLGDRLALERAILILADNALKYTPSGGNVTLCTAADARQATLTVKDTGIGIAAEHLPRLSERFYRADQARTHQSGGAGLGLAIAQGVAAAHGGTLRLSSEPNQGTAATLTLSLNGPKR